MEEAGRSMRKQGESTAHMYSRNSYCTIVRYCIIIRGGRRLAQSTTSLGGRSGERRGAVSRRSLTYVCSFPAVCFATV